MLILQKTGTKQNKADPCVFRKMVYGEVSVIVCVEHVDNIAVDMKGKETFGGFNMKLADEIHFETETTVSVVDDLGPKIVTGPTSRL